MTLLLRVYAIVLLVTGAGAGYVCAQEKTASQRPLYPLPRYEEDWSYLSDASKRNDFWDPIKFIPVSASSEVFLSLGGEIRETYERFHNTNFGLSPQDPNGYLLQRYLLHADLHAGQRFRIFAEFNSSWENGRTGGPRPVIDEEKLAIHQGFFDIRLANRGEDASLTLRIGRQEIALGSGRMVALREGPNVPFSLDGFRLSLHTTTWNVDGFATHPVQNKPGIFDDPPQHDFSFWGLYTTHRLSPGPARLALDFYYLGLDRKHSVYDQGAGHEIRHTLGVRSYGQHGRWNHDAEAMYQFGTFGTGTINAWRVALDNWYTFSSARWRPRIGLAADAASGDKDTSNPDLQTFNGLFQSGTYSGRAGILGPNNTIRLEPSVGLFLTQKLALSGGWGFYWRESASDGLYGIAGNLIVPSNGVKSRYEGSRPTLQLDWQITRHLSAHANYIYVFNAQFEERSVHGTSTMSFVSPWMTYRF